MSATCRSQVAHELAEAMAQMVVKEAMTTARKSA